MPKPADNLEMGGNLTDQLLNPYRIEQMKEEIGRLQNTEKVISQMLRQQIARVFSTPKSEAYGFKYQIGDAEKRLKFPFYKAAADFGFGHLISYSDSLELTQQEIEIAQNNQIINHQRIVKQVEQQDGTERLEVFPEGWLRIGQDNNSCVFLAPTTQNSLHIDFVWSGYAQTYKAFAKKDNHFIKQIGLEVTDFAKALGYQKISCYSPFYADYVEYSNLGFEQENVKRTGQTGAYFSKAID